MDDEKYQKELFEFEKPKRFLPRLSDFFPKADFERNVILTLTLDRAVFITIGIIMTMVVIYALGVETGKTRTVTALTEAQTPVAAAVPAKTAYSNIAPGNVKTVQGAQTAYTAMQARPTAQQPRQATGQPATDLLKSAPALSTAAKPYTIVAVTFTRRDTAVLEVNKLKRQGIDAVILPSDRYFQVCIGSYKDKTGIQTQKDLTRIKRLYKDAYVRMR